MLHIRSKIGKGAFAAAVSAAVVGLREPLLEEARPMAVMRTRA